MGLNVVDKEMENKIIPIVFTSNDAYVPITGTAIYSVVKNSSPAYQYNIYVFNKDITKTHKVRIKKLQKDNVSIEFVNVTEYIQDIPWSKKVYFPIETTFRLFIPRILNQYKKVIYLDCDMIIDSDVAELYFTDLADNYIAAAHDATTLGLKQYRENLGIPGDNIISSGVLLFNVDAFRFGDVEKKCFHLLIEDANKKHPRYQYLDEDALNVICVGKVKILPMKWNFAWYKNNENKDSDLVEPYRQEYIDNEEDVRIIHYSSYHKPWNEPWRMYADVFWSYAKETVFYEEIILNQNLKPKEKDHQILRMLYRKFRTLMVGK